MADPEKSLVSELGILGVEIDQRIAASATQLRGPHGIIVVARAAGATSEVPLLPGDIVRNVNNQPTATLQSARDLMRAMKPGTPVTLQVQREGRLLYVTFTID
jgi:S1-C subfamily serine protease